MTWGNGSVWGFCRGVGGVATLVAVTWGFLSRRSLFASVLGELVSDVGVAAVAANGVPEVGEACDSDVGADFPLAEHDEEFLGFSCGVVGVASCGELVGYLAEL
jgi:hypothetical protein